MAMCSLCPSLWKTFVEIRRKSWSNDEKMYFFLRLGMFFAYLSTEAAQKVENLQSV